MKLNDDSCFGYYLAGLFEGDGHIWVENNQSKKSYNPQFCITFHAKDLPLAEFIKNKIGFGWIRFKIRENAVVYSITNLKGYLLVLQLLNNKLRTPKIHQVNKLINWLNVKHGYNLSKMILCTSNLNDNAWLSGFSEADANFYIRVSQIKNKSRVAFRYSIDQRMLDHVTLESSESFLRDITNLFEARLNTVVRKHGTYFRIEITSKNSLKHIINYFDKFPLYGKKGLDYDMWKQGYLLYIDGTRLTEDKILQIRKLKLSMNNLRTVFNLTHF